MLERQVRNLEFEVRIWLLKCEIVIERLVLLLGVLQSAVECTQQNMDKKI